MAKKGVFDLSSLSMQLELWPAACYDAEEELVSE